MQCRLIYTVKMPIVLSIFLLLTFCSFCKLEENPPTVLLKQGKLKGFKQTSTNGNEILSFLAIPYAEPPLPFKDPIKHKGWKGERDGTQKGSFCPQLNRIKFFKSREAEYLGDLDCLYVNVHTANMNSNSLPVMVLFHGGAFVAGSANNFDPDELLDEEIVLVTVNYRVGIQGFLSTGDSVITGNFGLKDQTLALRWVNENIEKFGGDPKKVTILGESAGAASTHFHILSPKSEGLFSRAILQSGALICPWAMTSDVRNTALKIGNHFNCFEGDRTLEAEAKSRQLLDCLLKKDDKTLTYFLKKLIEWAWLPGLAVPHIDGDFIPEDPEVLMLKKGAKKIDVMYGLSRDEGALSSNGILAYPEDRRRMVDEFPIVGPISLAFQNEENAIGLSKEAYSKYVGGVKNGDKDFDNLTQMYGDRHFGVCVDLAAFSQAEINAGSDKNVYFYELHHRGQRSLSDAFNVTQGKHWISHADEIFYLYPMKLFGVVEINQEDKIVRNLFVKMWTNFAKTGNPTPDKSLGFVWEAFTPKSPKHLRIQPKPVMEKDTRAKVREYWLSLPTTQNKILRGVDDSKDEL